MIFVVGKLSKDFRAYFDAQGISYGMFVRADSKDVGRPNVFVVDFSSQQALTASLAQHEKLDVSGVIVCGYEHYVVPTAAIAQHYGVPGMPVEAARAATDKIIMRGAFQRHDASITPGFAAIEGWKDLAAFMETHQFPVMLKPANLMKSLYITRNDSLEQLRENYKQLCSVLPGAYTTHDIGEPRVIVEEFMAGSMHTVAGFVDADGGLAILPGAVDCVTAQQIGKHDSYLFSRSLPSALSHTDITALHEVTQRGVTALGLASTPIHAELILTDGQARIIEIGARLGGYRPRMYEYAHGIDMYRAALDTAEGKPIVIRSSVDRTSAVLELFADNQGICTAIRGGSQLAELASYQSSKSIAIGTETGPAAAGFRAPLTVVLGHEDQAQVAADCAYIRESIAIETAA